MSSSFQQNWIHSIQTSFAKVMAVQVLLFESGPEEHRRWSGVSGPKDPDTLVHCFSLPSDLLWCGSVVCPEVHRRWSGVSGLSESPAHRTQNLRSLVLAAILAKCGAPLDRGPELHRTMSGVSGLAGVSGPSGPESPVCPDDPLCPEPGLNLRPRPESPVHLHRSLRSEQAATASF